MTRSLRIVVALLLAAVTPAAALAAPQVSGIRHWTAPDHTRVVLDLQGDYDFRISTRQTPERIVIDVPGGLFDCGTENRPVGDTILDRIRCNRLRRGAQVVLDLKDVYSFKYFALDAIPGKKPRRLVVDVFPARRGEAPVPVVAEPAPAEAPPPLGREIVVVIDAGHGGEDPGAIHRGEREKTITLDIARRLERVLASMPGYRPVLTRSGDYYVPLARRRELADKAQGDLLISIHCNSAPNRNAGGIELYTLSTQGASSRRAQALADLENRSDLVGGIHPAAGDEEYRLVLSRQLTTAIERSGLVAESLREEARRDPVLKSNRRLKRAGLAVCKMVSMPSVLVEVGFFTNRNDFQLLSGPEGRQTYAEWLARGVDGYFSKHASTLFDPLFARRDKLIYKVRPGDNLTHIAKKFGVSVEDLVRANRLERVNHLGVGDYLLVVSETEQPVVHRVREGENLTLIARRYGVSVDSLLQVNRLGRSSLIRPGQELVILPSGAKGD